MGKLVQGEEPKVMRRRILWILVLMGTALWGCTRMQKSLFRTKVECCEEKAPCCTKEVCCLPRYAGGEGPQVQASAPPVLLPREALKASQEEEEERPTLLSRLNPLSYWPKKEEASPVEKRRQEENRSFLGKIFPF